jgi:carbonic anhydrase/acetyltransferase-like protein (isoleucine patch superfamily)
MSDEHGSDAEPKIDPSVWIAPSAQLYGAISIARDASVWHNAVLRAECQRIEIGRMTNLQDFAMTHIAYDNPTLIGDFCSITHHATVHGCTVGDHCLVGIGAVIMDHAVIGEGSIVAGGAFVRDRGQRLSPAFDHRRSSRQADRRARLRARQPPERLDLSPQRRVHPPGRSRSVDRVGIRSLAGGEARGDRSRSGPLRNSV